MFDFCTSFDPNLVPWSSKKQPLVARSSTDNEYRALSQTTPKLLWLESLFKELIIPFYPPALLCDNLSVVLLSHNPILHARTKHIELGIHFVRERVIEKNMKIRHLPSAL